jgi:hypothetical protein
MNNIVVYKIILTVGLLVLAISLSAQKPAIDLIPSSHQVMQLETTVDTSFTLDSLVNMSKHTQAPAVQKKVRRQIGPSIDSLLRKPETRDAKSIKTTGSISLYIRKFNPVKFFISIIALK